MISGAFWVDEISGFKENVGDNPNCLPTGFVVYPWHRSGSLNDDKIPDENATTKRTAVLERKKMSHLLYGTTVYNGPTF